MTTNNHSKQEDYQIIRRGIALSDLSETTQKLKLSGTGSLDVLNRVVLGDVSRLPVGRLMSTYMLKPDGTVLAEVYLWNSGDGYQVLSETSGSVSLAEWIRTHQDGNVCQILNVTDELGLLGLDGPFAWEILKEEIGVRTLGLRYLESMPSQQIGGIPVDILRAGKTGEFGYLIRCNAADKAAVWKRLLDVGAPLNVKPCGSDALNLAQLENRFTNMQFEGAAAANALELNCRIQVSRDKGSYVGQEAIEAAMTNGIQRRLIGVVFEGEGEIPQPGHAIFSGGGAIGSIASADWSPTLGKRFGVAFIATEYAYVGCSYQAGSAGVLQTVSAPFILNRSLSIRPQEDSFHTTEWSAKAVGP